MDKANTITPKQPVARSRRLSGHAAEEKQPICCLQEAQWPDLRYHKQPHHSWCTTGSDATTQLGKRLDLCSVQQQLDEAFSMLKILQHVATQQVATACYYSSLLHGVYYYVDVVRILCGCIAEAEELNRSRVLARNEGHKIRLARRHHGEVGFHDDVADEQAQECCAAHPV